MGGGFRLLPAVFVVSEASVENAEVDLQAEEQIKKPS